LEETLTAGVYIKTCSWLLDHARLRWWALLSKCES
jgi:hypothetical protein